MKIDLNGKVALVTGLTISIGRATVVGLAECGAKVILNGRRSLKHLRNLKLTALEPNPSESR